MKSAVFATASTLPLAGCNAAGLTSADDARGIYQQSVDNYRMCIPKKTGILKACDAAAF